MSDVGLEQAKDAADTARARLFATAHEIQARLEPSTLLDDAVSDVRDRSVRLARATSDTIRERPTAFGVAIATGAILAAYRPLFRLGRKLIGRAPKS